MAKITFNIKEKKYFIDIDYNTIIEDITNHKATIINCYNEKGRYYLAVITWYNHCIEVFKNYYNSPFDSITYTNPLNDEPIYNFTIEV